jgi:FMN phosphatase YigB (HAD superfamily)
MNVDVFSRFVAPHYRLHDLFDVVVSSSDERCLDKPLLWDKALLDWDVPIERSVLVDDNRLHRQRFRRMGGIALRYETDAGRTDLVRLPQLAYELGVPA